MREAPQLSNRTWNRFQNGEIIWWDPSFMTKQFHFEILECPYLQDPVATAKGVSKTSSVAAFQRWAGSLVSSSEKKQETHWNQHNVSKCPKVLTPHWPSSLHAPWPSEGTCVSSMEFQASDARVQTQTQVEIGVGQNSQLAQLLQLLRMLCSMYTQCYLCILMSYTQSIAPFRVFSDIFS